jgi:hypothetical protein
VDGSMREVIPYLWARCAQIITGAQRAVFLS